MIAPAELAILKACVGLVEIIGRRVKLDRKGRAYWGLCPFHKEKSPSFKVDNERRNYRCFGCGANGDAISWLQQVEGLSFIEAIKRLGAESGSSIAVLPAHDSQVGRTVYKAVEEDRSNKPRFLWRRRGPVPGSPVDRYLRDVRGYHGPIPATLGYLSPAKPGHHHAMIAAFGMAQEPEPGTLTIPDNAVKAVHLTLLKPDGSGKADTKPNKIMIGNVKGWPICIAPPNDLLGLAINEGIEDALSAHEATGLGAWAGGSAPFLPHVADVVPGYIDCASIMAHADTAGLTNASLLVGKLAARGISASLILLEGPPA